MGRKVVWMANALTVEDEVQAITHETLAELLQGMSYTAVLADDGPPRWISSICMRASSGWWFCSMS
jgi:hypothetical protein